MKSIKDKREMELKRIIRGIYGIKRRQENNQMMIVYDFLHMKVKQMQKNGLLWRIDIPEV